MTCGGRNDARQSQVRASHTRTVPSLDPVITCGYPMMIAQGIFRVSLGISRDQGFMPYMRTFPSLDPVITCGQSLTTRLLSPKVSLLVGAATEGHFP